jgi:hypothetical protein
MHISTVYKYMHISCLTFLLCVCAANQLWSTNNVEAVFREAQRWRLDPSRNFYGNPLELRPPEPDIEVRALSENAVDVLYWAVLDNPADGDFLVVHFADIDEADEAAMHAHALACSIMTQPEYEQLVEREGGGECADGNHLREVFVRWSKAGATDSRIKWHCFREVYYFPCRNQRYTSMIKQMGHAKNRQHDNLFRVDFMQSCDMARSIYEQMESQGQIAHHNFASKFKAMVTSIATTSGFGSHHFTGKASCQAVGQGKKNTSRSLRIPHGRTWQRHQTKNKVRQGQR